MNNHQTKYMITNNSDDKSSHIDENDGISKGIFGCKDKSEDKSDGDIGDDYFNICTSAYNINNCDDIDDIDGNDGNDGNDGIDDNDGNDGNDGNVNIFKESIIGTLKNTNNIISILYNKIVSLIKKNILLHNNIDQLNNNIDQLNNKFIRLNNKFKKMQEINKLTELDEFIIKEDYNKINNDINNGAINNGAINNGAINNGAINNGAINNGNEPKITKKLLNNNIDKLLIDLVNNNSDINLSEMLIDTKFKATKPISNVNNKVINTNFKAPDAVNNENDNNEKELCIKNKLRNIIIETQKVAEIKNTINKRKKNILFNI